MTRQEAADFLRITTRTLDRWTTGGRIERIEIEGGERPTIRYRHEDVLALVGARYTHQPVHKKKRRFWKKG